jgi:membrane protein YdbS with pleckstrin-like domain
MSETEEGGEPRPAQWHPLPPEAATTAMFGGAAMGLLLGAGAAFFIAFPLSVKGLDLEWWQALLLALVLWLLVGALGTFVAYRRWLSTAWKLDDTGLHFRRGRMWRKEVLVPRSRVQHLDIERGPIERRYGLATLIVHTAGTRQHALRIAGLPDADAVALRDALVPDPSRHDDVL